MKKNIFFLVLAVVAAGGIFAQGYDSDLNTNLPLGGLLAPSSYVTGADLTQYADGVKWGGNAFFAGLANTVFGIWSWTNGDILGGVITTVLEAGGWGVMIGAMAMGNNSADYEEALEAIGLYVAGGLLLATGWVYGLITGMVQFSKRSASTAKAFNENPMKNMSFVLLPTCDNKVTSVLTYSVSF
jgi:hypothetical protein